MNQKKKPWQLAGKEETELGRKGATVLGSMSWLWGTAGDTRVLSRSTPSSSYPLLPAQLLEVEACSRFALGNVLHAQRRMSTRPQGTGESHRRRNTAHSTRVARTGSSLARVATREKLLQNVRAQLHERRESHTLWTLNIYYDDVSSGPRPQAHWYMLTHRAVPTQLLVGPRIALHRVPIPLHDQYSI